MVREVTDDDKRFRRGTWTRFAEQFQKKSPSAEDVLKDANACAADLHGLGECISDYLASTGEALQFTLMMITKKVLCKKDDLHPETIFDFIQQMRRNLLNLASLCERELNQMIQFARLTGSLKPSRYFADCRSLGQSEQRITDAS